MDSRSVSSLLAIALSGTALVSCGHPVQRQLDGRWLGDGVERFSDNLVAPATAWVRGTSFEFASTNLTVVIPPESTRRGTYSVTRVSGRDVYLAVEGADGKKDPLHLKLDGEHTIRWMLDDERAVVLKREL